MKDNFSSQAAAYAKYRPDYPAALFEYILQFVPLKKTAWDCATGNGQSALVLSNYFELVIATDISNKQLNNAATANNIHYAVQPAEHTTIKSNSIDLITVAQAIHWFDFEKFYSEAVRVATKDAIIAIWCYSLLTINPAIDAIINEYHFTTLANYWDAERKYVDEGYQNIPFPFGKIETPSFVIEKYWTIDELEGYLNTWSALQKFIALNDYNPVAALIKKISRHWGDNQQQKIIFPIHLIFGNIK
jgi:ubiquinone/menaquinone biosynthesis C-methylase UbiE